MAEKEAGEDPKGIAGWLILVVIGLVVSPLRTLHALYENHWLIIRDGIWPVLTTPGTEHYHPLWAPLFAFEVFANVGSVLLALIALALLLQKSRHAPRLAIVWLGWGVVFGVLDYVIAGQIPAVAEQSGSEAIRELSRSVAGAAIWIPYFLRSRRVKNTFVQ
ncbi:DUF2569 domain-containing protein [Rubrivivax albus]|uniref:DUF2569 domain-containing protein n=1 Tax=Rubrivivax albus TaxID=2499835 RepID=UPI0013051C92|nr:DUF2569 domain-containing protein [Rubrivivax albus]